MELNGLARILLVEDSKQQAESVKGALEGVGYEIILAEDGKSAIKEAVSGNADLILLDLVLPDMSGVEVCRWLKMNQSTRLIPILMLSSKGEVNDKVTGIEAGADDYLPKPYSDMELTARIYALLRTKALQDELSDKNVQLERLLAKVETLAITDPLTELFNRRHMASFIDKEIKASFRYGSPLSCLMIDIDSFKAINDDFGHKVGDSVLRDIAGMISDAIREVDTAARWGGEEFVVLLPRCTKEDAKISAARILQAVSNHQFPSVEGRRITVSIGISGVPDPSIENADNLLDAADRAMYKAKQNGRNRIEKV
jgi:diguanylate cyclase (GGDEF)-like protein